MRPKLPDGMLAMAEPAQQRQDAQGAVAGLVVARQFFFFQAEDGIRDLTVTGVQTCALPISAAGARAGVAGMCSANAAWNCDWNRLVSGGFAIAFGHPFWAESDGRNLVCGS